jgi:hypothetical protein
MDAVMNAAFGVVLLAGTVLSVLALRPRNGKETLVMRLPGSWIVCGLVLTATAAGGVALLLRSIGFLE